MIYFIIYKITNTKNNKVYIGKHQTDNINDNYMGSGKLLKYAQEKYGIEYFKKEILFVFETEEEMNSKEIELVTEDFCSDENTYNICVGGKGGFSYINKNSMNYKFTITDSLNGVENRTRSKVWKESLSQRKYDDRKYDHFRGDGNPAKRDEIKIKISANRKGISSGVGSKNSQFGTCWITNGIENKKVSKNDLIPYGWYKGRKMKEDK